MSTDCRPSPRLLYYLTAIATRLAGESAHITHAHSLPRCWSNERSPLKITLLKNACTRIPQMKTHDPAAADEAEDEVLAATQDQSWPKWQRVPLDDSSLLGGIAFLDESFPVYPLSASVRENGVTASILNAAVAGLGAIKVCGCLYRRTSPVCL